MNILIIHRCLGNPLRGTSEDHLYSFYKYSRRNNVFYLRLDDYTASMERRVDRIPDYLKRLNFDVIVFHYGFASARFAGNQYWEETVNDVRFFRNSGAIKVLFVQDEYQNTIVLNNFINEYKINIVYTLSQEENFSQIFNKIDRSKVKLLTTLTGYIDLTRVRRNRLLFGRGAKNLDVGYRARKLPPWFGRHAHRKALIADVFNKALEGKELSYDISTAPEDTLFGKDWDRFLYRCKYMIGVESGASLHDPDGSILFKCLDYEREHKDFTFEEVEGKFFPGMDGNLNLFVLSPRNFECSASMTCQVLVEGEYNGILKPNIHYIPIAKDFSNVDEVIAKMKDDNLRDEITRNAYSDLIASGNYTYEKFAHDFFLECEGQLNGKYVKAPVVYSLLSIYSYYFDRLTYVHERMYRLLRKYTKWYFIDKFVALKRENRMARSLYQLFFRPILKLFRV